MATMNHAMKFVIALTGLLLCLPPAMAAETQADSAALQQARKSLGLAYEYLETGRPQEAIREYEKILAVYKDKPLIYYNLGIAYYMLGEVDEAIAYYRKALMINPRHADAHANLAQALDKKGETRQALESYLQSLLLDMSDKEVRLKLAAFYLNHGRPDDAARELERILKADPDYGPAHYWKAKVLFGAADYAGAWKHLHRARDLGYTKDDIEPEFIEALKGKMAEPPYDPPKPENAVTSEFLDRYLKERNVRLEPIAKPE